MNSMTYEFITVLAGLAWHPNTLCGVVCVVWCGWCGVGGCHHLDTRQHWCGSSAMRSTARQREKGDPQTRIV